MLRQFFIQKAAASKRPHSAMLDDILRKRTSEFAENEAKQDGTSVATNIKSLISSLVPTVKVSFEKDSFAKDPFFKPAGRNQRDFTFLDVNKLNTQLTYLKFNKIFKTFFL